LLILTSPNCSQIREHFPRLMRWSLYGSRRRRPTDNVWTALGSAWMAFSRTACNSCTLYITTGSYKVRKWTCIKCKSGIMRKWCTSVYKMRRMKMRK